MKLVILGPPGSGKGTQAKNLSSALKIPQISSGDILREKEGELSENLREMMKRGELIPDELIVKIIKERIKAKDCRKGYILDGFPRTLLQAREIDEEEIELVLFINCGEKEIIKRLEARRNCRKCGKIYHLINNPPKKEMVCDICRGKLYQRDDDKVYVIKKRLSIYHQEIQPLIEYYKEKNLIKFFDGEKKPHEVLQELLQEVKLSSAQRSN